MLFERCFTFANLLSQEFINPTDIYVPISWKCQPTCANSTSQEHPHDPISYLIKFRISNQVKIRTKHTRNGKPQSSVDKLPREFMNSRKVIKPTKQKKYQQKKENHNLKNAQILRVLQYFKTFVTLYKLRVIRSDGALENSLFVYLCSVSLSF